MEKYKHTHTHTFMLCKHAHWKTTMNRKLQEIIQTFFILQKKVCARKLEIAIVQFTLIEYESGSAQCFFSLSQSLSHIHTQRGIGRHFDFNSVCDPPPLTRDMHPTIEIEKKIIYS